MSNSFYRPGDKRKTRKLSPKSTRTETDGMRQCWSTKGGGRAPRGKKREIEKESTDGCWITRTEMDHPKGGKQGNAKWGKMRSPVCGLSNNANRLSHITVLFPLFQRLAQGVVSHYRGGGVRGLERGIVGLSAF